MDPRKSHPKSSGYFEKHRTHPYKRYSPSRENGGSRRLASNSYGKTSYFPNDNNSSDKNPGAPFSRSRDREMGISYRNWRESHSEETREKEREVPGDKCTSHNGGGRLPEDKPKQNRDPRLQRKSTVEEQGNSDRDLENETSFDHWRKMRLEAALKRNRETLGTSDCGNGSLSETKPKKVSFKDLIKVERKPIVEKQGNNPSTQFTQSKNIDKMLLFDHWKKPPLIQVDSENKKEVPDCGNRKLPENELDPRLQHRTNIKAESTSLETSSHLQSVSGSSQSSPEKMNKKDDRGQSQVLRLGDWSLHLGTSGKLYYFNYKTNASQWHEPPEWRNARHPSTITTINTEKDCSSNSATKIEEPGSGAVLGEAVNSKHQSTSSSRYDPNVVPPKVSSPAPCNQKIKPDSSGNQKQIQTLVTDNLRTNAGGSKSVTELPSNSSVLDKRRKHKRSREKTDDLSKVPKWMEGVLLQLFPEPSQSTATTLNASEPSAPLSNEEFVQQLQNLKKLSKNNSPPHTPTCPSININNDHADSGNDNIMEKEPPTSTASKPNNCSSSQLMDVDYLEPISDDETDLNIICGLSEDVKTCTPAQSSSLDKYYRSDLTNYMNGWAASDLEKRADELPAMRNVMNIQCAEVSVQLKVLRSHFGLAEIEKVLQDQRLRYIRQRMEKLESRLPDFTDDEDGPGVLSPAYEDIDKV